jgi:hypothetical protein
MIRHTASGILRLMFCVVATAGIGSSRADEPSSTAANVREPKNSGAFVAPQTAVERHSGGTQLCSKGRAVGRIARAKLPSNRAIGAVPVRVFYQRGMTKALNAGIVLSPDVKCDCVQLRNLKAGASLLSC